MTIRYGVRCIPPAKGASLEHLRRIGSIIRARPYDVVKVVREAR